MKFEDASDLMKAADAHNIAASGTSSLSFSTPEGFDFDSVSVTPEEQEEKFGPDFLYDPLVGIPTTLVAGGIGLVNSITGLLNFTLPVDAEFAPIDTGEVMASLDSNMADYYTKNKASADLWGFVAGSIVPGLGAIKVLKAGQTALRGAAAGEIGTNTSLATRLLVPNTELQVKIHGAELAARNATWKFTNRNTLKTIASGAHQGLLEGIVAETAILATGFKSPIFDDFELSDHISNYSIGIALGGPLGAIGGLGASYFGTKTLMRNAQSREFDLAVRATPLPFTSKEGKFSTVSIGELADEGGGFLHTDMADAIVQAGHDISQVVKPITVDEVLAAKKLQKESGYSISPAAVEEETRFLNRQRELNIEKLKNTIRTNIRELEHSPNAKKDLDFGNLIADLYTQAPVDSITRTFDRMREFVRLGEKSPYEKQLASIMKSAKVSKEEAMTVLGSNPTKYIQLHSGIAGETLDRAPQLLRMADKADKTTVKKLIAKELSGLKESIEDFGHITKNMSREAFQSIEARWAAASRLTDNKLEKLGTSDKPIFATDLPLMRAMLKTPGNRRSFIVMKKKGKEWEAQVIQNKDALEKLYQETQLEMADRLGRRGHTPDLIEHVTDLRGDILSGKAKYSKGTDTRFYSAQEHHADTLSKKLGKEISPDDLYLLPKYAKVTYADDLEDMDSGNVLRGIQGIAYRQKLYEEATERVTTSYFGEWAARFIPITNKMLASAWRGGIGQGLVRNAGGSLGSLETFISQNANIVSQAEKTIIGGVKQNLEGATQTLIRNPNVAIRFSGLNEILAGQVERFTLSKEGAGLIPVKIAKWEDDVIEAVASGNPPPPRPALAKGTPEFIEIPDAELYSVVKDHMDRDFVRNSHKRNAASLFGPGHAVDYAFYPVRQDPRDFKHVAFVVDTTMTGVGHKRMLLARNAKDLEDQINRVPEHLKVITDPQSQEFHKAVGDWLYDSTLHDNYLDSELATKGVRSNYFPMTDPQLIANTFLQHHIRSETALFREMVKSKFSHTIEVLERRGRIYSNIADSSTDHISKLHESSRNNPYTAMIKSLLNISRLEDVPGFWLTAQQKLDQAVSRAWNVAYDAVWRNKKLTNSNVIAATQRALATLPKYHLEFSQFTNMGQALDFIAEKTGNPFEVALAKRMRDTLKDVPFHVAESGMSIPGGLPKSSATSFGTWLPETGVYGRVVVKGASFGNGTAGITNKTVLHEALHAFLEAKLLVGEAKKGEAAETFYRRYTELWEKFTTSAAASDIVPSEWDALNILAETPPEFVTYALTNPRLRKALEQIPGTTKGTTLGSEFVETTVEALGMKKSDSNLLVDLLNNVELGGNTALTDKAVDYYNALNRDYTVVDNVLAESDAAFNDIGFRSAYWGAAEQIFANTRIDQGVLTKFIRTADRFLVNTILRWDPFNAIVNKLSLPIIMMPEIKSLIEGIKAGNADAAGELARLAEIVVPGTGNDRILSPYKLIANAYKILHSGKAGPILHELRRRGIVVDTMDQYYKSIDAVTITGHETVRDLQSKMSTIRDLTKQWSDTLAVASGNEWVERTNRAVAALVMKQLTDLGVKHKVITEKEAWAYINLFSNRVNGVIRAAERPLMFQGPIGQAMGLFQSYQFNLIQQAFRHIGEGNVKYTAMMAGLQSTMFGASSLPGFDIINDRLIGDAAGNKNHTDAYMVSSDWLLYGMPSYFTSSALFTRGDINPRSWTVVPNPTNPTELPVISSMTKAFGSIKTAFTASANGAPMWDSFLLGLEHLGLSRPLSGLAVSLRGLTNDELRAHSTQKNGQFLYANDLLSLTTLMRMAGSKPFDEAKMLNDFYRINAYASADRKRRVDLGVAMKVSLAGGNVPDAETIGDFAAEYLARGGSQRRFNTYYMEQLMNANKSQAQQLSERLSSPYGRSMQYLLGGRESLTALE